MVWLNGQFIPQTEAVLPWNDTGLIFGATVTDLIRTFNHIPFRLSQHLDRFFLSAEHACIPLNYGKGEVETVAGELIQHNARHLKKKQDLALVLFATPGAVGYYFGQEGGPGEANPVLGIHSFPLPLQRYQKWIHEGVDLATPAIRQAPNSLLPTGIKHRSRLHWWMGNREVKRMNPSAEAMLLDMQGHLTETAFANFVLVKNPEKPLGKQLFLVPPIGSVLPGVTLEVTRKFAMENGIAWEEKPLSPQDVKVGDAALLTGTSFCFAHVHTFNSVRLTRPDSTLEALNHFWKGVTGLDVRQQILAYP